MTLGGLALAVGVLVDEGTVLMENIHVHLAQGENKAAGGSCGSREVAIPRLLAMLSVLAVFLPSFFMTGPAASLFVPLSLAVGFSMGASYLLSSSSGSRACQLDFEAGEERGANTQRKNDSIVFANASSGALERIMEFPELLLGAYAVIAVLILVLLGPSIGGGNLPVLGIDAVPPTH